MKIGIIGLGYVGLPLCVQFAKSGASVMGIDVDAKKIDSLNRGESYIKHISSDELREQREANRLEGTTDYSRVRELEALILCVPTPLNEKREPDLSYVFNTAQEIAPYLPLGITVILESTTYPGTTEDELRSILESGSEMRAGVDFYLAYSPEREDPGNPDSKVSKIPKVIGGYTWPVWKKRKSLSNCNRTFNTCFESSRGGGDKVARKYFSVCEYSTSK